MAASAATAALVLDRIEVTGTSMVPTLLPGDRLLVVKTPRRWPLRPGMLVTVADPRSPSRLLVKRVHAIGPGWIDVRGDHVEWSTDSRSFGRVSRELVFGAAVYRYAPAERSGTLGAAWSTTSAPRRRTTGQNGRGGRRPGESME